MKTNIWIVGRIFKHNENTFALWIYVAGPIWEKI